MAAGACCGTAPLMLSRLCVWVHAGVGVLLVPNTRVTYRKFWYPGSSKQRRPPPRPDAARLPSACAAPTVSWVVGGRPLGSGVADGLGAPSPSPSALARSRLVCGMSNLVACDGAVYAFGSALYPMNLQSVSNPSLVSLSLSFVSPTPPPLATRPTLCLFGSKGKLHSCKGLSRAGEVP